MIVNLSVCTAGVIFRKWSPVPMCSKLFPTFSSIRFSVTGFMLRSFLYLDLSFVTGDVCGSICILLHPVRSAPFVEDAFFFPLHIFDFFVKNLVFIDVWIYVTVFDWIPLIHVSVFMPIPIFFITQLCSEACCWVW